MANPEWLGGRVYIDSDHRFVTDKQIISWNSKAEGDHTHPYLPLTGGTLTGSLIINNANALLTVTNSTDNKSIKMGSIDGELKLYGYDGSSVQPLSINPNGGLVTVGSGGLTTSGKITASGGFVGNATSATTASKVTNSLDVQFNGTTQATYNGSAEKTVNITPAAIGASPTTHTHSYAGSASVGGPANRVANNMIIQFNGTTQATYNGSAEKTVNITPAAIKAIASEPATGYSIIYGNLRVTGSDKATTDVALLQAFSDKGASLFLNNTKVQWRVGIPKASTGNTYTLMNAEMSNGGTVSGPYQTAMTIASGENGVTYLYGSVVSSYAQEFKSDGKTLIGKGEYQSAAAYIRSVRAKTPLGSIGIYNTGNGGPNPTSKRGVYMWKSDADTSDTITNPGWLLYYDDDDSLVHIPKQIITPSVRVAASAGSGINWRNSSTGVDYLLIGYGNSMYYSSYTRVGNAEHQMCLFTSKNVWKNGSTTTYFSTATTSSDNRLKERISDMSKYEEFFTKINPFAFKYHDGLYNADNTKPLIKWGYSAQETIKAFNECGINWEEQDLVVVEDAELSKEESKYIDDGKLLKMTYQNMIPLNTHMIQKVMEENKKLKEENEKLKNDNLEFKSRFSVIESALSRIMNKLDM